MKDRKIMPVLAFLPFGFRSVLTEVCEPRSARKDAPQVLANEVKSTRGDKPKGMQKSEKKPALIPYLDNIETTSIKIFAETPEISGKNRDLWYNRNYSNYNIELLYYYFIELIDFIFMIKLLGEFIREIGVSLKIKSIRKDYD